jgi:AIR synthase-related protein
MKPVGPDAYAALLAASPAFRSKCDIARVAHAIDAAPRAVDRWQEQAGRILLGDDTAAIPDGAGYLLFAAEGMLPALLDRDPYFAGWCAVMVNVSDVAAMGGFPLAAVDVYFHSNAPAADKVLAGIRDACGAYGVPLVGGHTTRSDHGPHVLAVAILGKADALLTSFGARVGDDILFAVDLRGSYRGVFPFWNSTSARAAKDLRDDLAVFGSLAALGVAHACKDVSNAGVAGTLLMMLEASGVGAVLDLDVLPRPDGVALDRWLLTFPSFGFLIAAPPDRANVAQALFRERGLTCERVGPVDASSQLRLASNGREALLWDLGRQAFTGFGPARPA